MTLISCEAFYNTNTRQLTVHVPSDKHIGFESDSDTMQNPPAQPRRRGRPSIYSSDEERKAKHREQALRHYYRKKALQEATSLAASFESSKKEQQNSHSDDEVRLTISTHSKTLGDISEDITFKRVNGRLRKQHEK